MARTCFFSFRYRNVFRVNQIRSMPNIIGNASAGFKDASLWEDAKKSEKRIKEMIDKALLGTSVTVICITYGISQREWINYEIDESIKCGNGLVGIQLHHLSDPSFPDDRVGAAPSQIASNGFKTYQYTNKENLAKHIEEAAKIAGR
jgi:Thoeris protein ThsB, TIR-like domain